MKKINLPESEEELRAECRFRAYRASGSGGQHINVTDSAIRLTHIPTGLVVTSQKERSQYLNKKICLSKLRKLVARLNYRPPKRIATHVPKSVVNENLEKKARHSQKKRLRRLPSQEE